MKKLLLSTLAITAMAFSAFAQNPTTHEESMDSTTTDGSPCFLTWDPIGAFQGAIGHDFTAMTWNSSEKTLEFSATTHATEHGPLFYQLSGGTRAACTPAAGLVDITTQNKFQIRAKATVPMQINVYLQEGNAIVYDYSKFSNSSVEMNLTTEMQTFDLLSVLDSNIDKTAFLDISKIGAIAFELGKTDETNYDEVTGATVSVDFIRFGEAFVGVSNVSVESISVYPNPASDIVNVVVGSANASVSLTDVTGKVVASATGSGTVVLSTTDVPAGLYVVSVKSDEGVTTAKVIVK
jgi:hypothetical protein